MRIVVASGKGGTGKTTVATSLALAAGDSCHLLDCDVEAPNASIFLHPRIDDTQVIGILLPVVDETSCTFCGRCAEVCEFHAIAVIGKKTLVFPELCHGCGSCTWICPENAIHEILEVTGCLENGRTPTGIDFSRGVMNIGEAMPVPIIRQLKKWKTAGPDILEILDSPPGASCPVVETLRNADFALLVTEPTPFGYHDLKQVVGIVNQLGLPSGVIVNRAGVGDDSVDQYCRENGIPILMRIPFQRRFSEAIATGKTLVEAAPEYRQEFQSLLETIQSTVTR
jgi:MinD superfamily P-loop ATPase